MILAEEDAVILAGNQYLGTGNRHVGVDQLLQFPLQRLQLHDPGLGIGFAEDAVFPEDTPSDRAAFG
ncbi:hypothetical protein D3C81_2065310 [compost metagenome]